MPTVTIHLNDRSYDIVCDPGQQDRVQDLGRYIDDRLQQILDAGGAGRSDSYAMVLTMLVLADEVFSLKDGSADGAGIKGAESDNGIRLSRQEADQLLDMVQHLRQRVSKMTDTVENGPLDPTD